MRTHYAPFSAGWREVCRLYGVDPDATHPDVDPTTQRALIDPDRTARNRRKHRRGVSS